MAPPPRTVLYSGYELSGDLFVRFMAKKYPKVLKEKPRLLAAVVRYGTWRHFMCDEDYNRCPPLKCRYVFFIAARI